jgi:perosamine synthetase
MQKLFAKIDSSIKRNLIKLVDNKNWNIYRGEFVNKVERECYKFFNVRALTVNSGSSALELCLRALKIKSGDEIIMPSFTFVATAQAVLLVGATPVLCETDEDTFNLSVENIKKVITKKTKGIIFVHLFGNPSNIDSVLTLCKKKNLYLIEDCAQSFGASVFGKSVGTFGDCGAFSFNSCKHISCGEGGLFISKNKNIYERARMIRHAGMKQNKKHIFVSEIVGGKSLMTELQAAVILPQLEKWNLLFEKRQKDAKLFLSHVSNVPEFKIQKVLPGAKHAYQRIVFLAKDYKQTIRLMEKNKFLERIYPVPLVNEPIIRREAVFDNITKKKALDFWQRHIGFTFMPFVDYSSFIKGLNIKK